MSKGRAAAIDGAAVLALLRVIKDWSNPDGAIRVDADERDEFDGEILAALRGAVLAGAFDEGVTAEREGYGYDGNPYTSAGRAIGKALDETELFQPGAPSA